MTAIIWANPANGDWDVAANWSTDTVPTSADDVTISAPGRVAQRRCYVVFSPPCNGDPLNPCVRATRPRADNQMRSRLPAYRHAMNSGCV